jgi:hypothetical protein
VKAIAQYPEDFRGQFGGARIREINRKLPSINTDDPQAIDLVVMLVWLDRKYNLDNNNVIVFELWEYPGLWFLKDFDINVTFCDPVKAIAAQQLSQAWNNVQSQRSEEARQHYRDQSNLLEPVLYGTDSEVLFAWPSFEVDPHRSRLVVPKIIANTRRTIRVKRVARESGMSVAYTVQPDGTLVQVP